jgi:hypothetical protein
MNGKACPTCEHYVDVAYFCLKRNTFLFPEHAPSECIKWEIRTEKNINLNKKRIKF